MTQLFMREHSGNCCGVRELSVSAHNSYRDFDPCYHYNRYAYLGQRKDLPARLADPAYSVELFPGLLLCNVQPWEGMKDLEYRPGLSRLRPQYYEGLASSLRGGLRLTGVFWGFALNPPLRALSRRNGYCVLNWDQLQALDYPWFLDQGWVPRARWTSRTTGSVLFAFVRNAT